MLPKQLSLFTPDITRPFNYPFPSTRYQGSKRTLTEWIWETVYHLQFSTVLDVFGGTGAVSHMFKNAGKQVLYNDILAFNHQIGLALIQNSGDMLTDHDIEQLLTLRVDNQYSTFIQDTFESIYFTAAENRWLDEVVQNIQHVLENPYKKALAYFALFQACIIKRPYNLFHRANLYMRTAQVERSFGNKTTWDTPFETHFRQFIKEANNAVFDNQQQNQALQLDAFDTPIGADLVYIDPPYLNRKGTGVDYRDFYHFLEGMVNYQTWANQVDYGSKHRRLLPIKSVWNNTTTITDAFEALIARHRDSILVISYRDDGIPSKQTLIDLLLKFKRDVYEATQSKQYALAHHKTHEVLLVALC